MSDSWQQQRYDDAYFALHGRMPGEPQGDDGFDCAGCGAYVNPAAYRPGTPQRSIVELSRRCLDCAPWAGSEKELADLFRDSDDYELRDKVRSWGHASVARHLAEAGAVHPAVHTPERVIGWLERYGWKRHAVTDLTIWWERDDGVRVLQPLLPKSVDYARLTGLLVGDVARLHELTVTRVLMEIASMPEESAW